MPPIDIRGGRHRIARKLSRVPLNWLRDVFGFLIWFGIINAFGIAYAGIWIATLEHGWTATVAAIGGLAMVLQILSRKAGGP